MLSSCFICGGAFQPYMTGEDYNSKTTTEKFDIIKCEKCGVEKISPMPTNVEIGMFYPQNYYSYNAKKAINKTIFDKLIDFGFQNPVFGKILSRWKMGIPFHPGNGKTFLDIGCGDGYTMDFLSTKGWDVYGFEIGEVAIKDNIYYAESIVDIDFGEKKFDFIRISHVLEHVPNPIEFLGKVKSMCHSETLIDITLPNTQSFDAIVFGKYWFNRDVPRHLINYNIDNLNTLFKNQGFTVIKRNFLLGFGLGGSLLNLTKYKWDSESFYRIFNNRIVRYSFLFIDLILSLLHLGDHMGFRIKTGNK